MKVLHTDKISFQAPVIPHLPPLTGITSSMCHAVTKPLVVNCSSKKINHCTSALFELVATVKNNGSWSFLHIVDRISSAIWVSSGPNAEVKKKWSTFI